MMDNYIIGIIIVIVSIGIAIGLIWYVTIDNIIKTDQEDEKLHSMDCTELREYLRTESEPTQHALNHFTVCIARGLP
jgi:hypothetical protein